MSQKLKRLKSQVEEKKQIALPASEKSHKKTIKTPKQTTPITTYLHHSALLHQQQMSSHFNSNNHTNYSLSKQPPQHPQKQASSNVKLHRIQSEYIKPINSQSHSKTPKVSKPSANKIIIDSTKMKKYPQRQEQHYKDYMQTQPKKKLSKKIEEFNKNAEFVQSPLLEMVKKSMKTSKISSKSLTREQSSFKNNPTINPIGIKDKAKTKRYEPYSQKSDAKRLSKKGIDSTKLTQQNLKTPSLKKAPSTCSVKKYYILQKSKGQKRPEKQAIALTTYRGFSNPEENPLSQYRKSSTTILKIYNSSTDLNNTTHSSEKEREILERVQRTLEYYRMNLDEEVEKRKNLEVENVMLRDELMKVMGKGNGRG